MINKIMGIDITQGQGANFDSIIGNDFGIILGAGYSISEKVSMNAGLYRGLKDHDGGKFNNLFLDIGYSF